MKKIAKIAHISYLSGVYRILNQANNKVYIGSSKNMHRRLERHLRELKNNRHCNDHLQSAWNRYGENSFEISEIELCSIDNIASCEQKYLDIYKAYDRDFGYNCHKTAYIPTHTPESKEKLRIASTGKKHSPETNAKKSRPGELNPFYGKKHSKAKIIQILETRGVILKEFACIETGDVFLIVEDACRVFKNSRVGDAISGKRPMANNYHFMYLEKIDVPFTKNGDKIIMTLVQKAYLVNKLDKVRKLFICDQDHKLYSSYSQAAKFYDIQDKDVMNCLQLRSRRNNNKYKYTFTYVPCDLSVDFILPDGQKRLNELNSVSTGRKGSDNPMFGKPATLEKKIKSLASIGRSPRPFICIETGEKFLFPSQAAKRMNGGSDYIRSNLNGKTGSSNDLHYVYINRIPFSFTETETIINISDTQRATLIDIIDKHKNLFICKETGKLYTSLQKAEAETDVPKGVIDRMLYKPNNEPNKKWSFHFELIPMIPNVTLHPL